MARSKIEPIEVAASDPNTVQRIRAGLLAEGGLADPEVLKHWQERVKAGEFEPDACTRELLAADPGEAADAQLERRSGVLLRDLVMAPLATAGRKRGKRKVQTGAAMLISQVFMLLVWGGLFLTTILVLRIRDVSIDGILDSMLGVFN